jgi:putative addiction module killer protein
MVQLRAYIDEQGKRPFDLWLEQLEAEAVSRITIALTRIELGNFAQVKGVGLGVYESKIDYGPGYRVYFGKDGERIVILLGGGTKKRQPRDIAVAQAHWALYKRRKKLEK